MGGARRVRPESESAASAKSNPPERRKTDLRNQSEKVARHLFVRHAVHMFSNVTSVHAPRPCTDVFVRVANTQKHQARGDELAPPC